ncbi:MAG: TonB-dependent receptor [Burkholderiales bacterium]
MKTIRNTVSRRAVRAAAVVLAACAHALVAPPVAAQDAQPKSASLDPVVVTAARAPQSFNELTADVTVIGADEIARSGADSLVQLLQRQPGVEISMNGGRGGVSSAFIRGANANHTLVLVDGMRVSSSTTGASTLEAIPLDQIERIEILRGPASSLYGADAVGGVVQVFTRDGGRAFSANASASVGTHATAVGAAGVSGSAGDFRYSVQVAAKKSDGFNAIVDPANFSYNDDRDGYDGRSVTASGTWRWAKDQELTLRAFHSFLDAQYDGGPGFDDRQVTRLSGWSLASANRIGERWRWTLTAGESRDDSVSKTGFGDFPFETRQRQYSWQHDLALSFGDLTLAYERREERVISDSGFPRTRRDTDSALAILRARGGPHALQANLRVDDSDQYGTRTTGSLAYGYAFAPGWRATVGAATAFRAPTFNDLYFPGFSNPDLTPERSRSVEAGLAANGTAGDVRYDARVTGWLNDVSGLIVFACDADFNCAPINAEKARLAGATIAGEMRWRDTTLKASVDLQEPQNRTTGNLLPRRARAHGALAVAQAWGRLRAGAELVASSYRYDDAANTRRMGGYGVLNLSAEWNGDRGVTLFVRAENVFDRDYEIAAGYSTGGAQVTAGVRWAM